MGINLGILEIGSEREGKDKSMTCLSCKSSRLTIKELIFGV